MCLHVKQLLCFCNYFILMQSIPAADQLTSATWHNLALGWENQANDCKNVIAAPYRSNPLQG